MLLCYGEEIGFFCFERILCTEFRQRRENLINKRSEIGYGSKNKLYFVDIQNLVLQDRLCRRKEAALNAPCIQQREDICEMIAVTIIESQQEGVRWQTFFGGGNPSNKIRGREGGEVPCDESGLPHNP